MDERGAMDHLDDSAQANRAFAAMAAISRGKQEQGGTHTLAAALAQITGYLDDRVNRAAILGGDLLLDESQIVPDQIKNAFRELNGERHPVWLTGPLSARSNRRTQLEDRPEVLRGAECHFFAG